MNPKPDVDLHADALENLRAAAAVQVPEWLALVSALASVRPGSISETIDWLVQHRATLESTYSESKNAPLVLARLDQDMHYEPELAGLDRPRDDHFLRDKYVFADLVGNKTYFQVIIWAITGVALSKSDAEMLEQIGVANFAADRRVWPLAVTRRVAAHGGDFSSAIVAGHAVMGSPIVGSRATGSLARFMIWAKSEVAKGRSLEAVVDEALSRGEKIKGFGRPVVGPDERVAPVRAIIEKYGREGGSHLVLVQSIEELLQKKRGLQSNVAAWITAVMCDLGFSPDGVHAVTMMYLTPCVFAQAVFSRERGVDPSP